MSESRGADGDDREWAVTLEDLEGDDGDGRPAPEPIEPESPSAESVAFVLLGVALTMVVLFGGL